MVVVSSATVVAVSPLSGSSSEHPAIATAARANAAIDRAILLFLIFSLSVLGGHVRAIYTPLHELETRHLYTMGCKVVYMTRTNIDIDDRLVELAMERYNLRTKKEAVNLALEKLVGGVMTKEQALAMEGYGWHGDLVEIRGSGGIEVIWED